MFRLRRNGTPSSASWNVISSVRARFFASPTCTSASCRSVRRMSRVTASSSLMATRLFVPGESSSSQGSDSPSPNEIFPRVISTVVPG
jgi:hypothetical protein